jgi:hypothetical protein
MVLRSLAKAARAGAGSASMYALTSIAEATVVEGGSGLPGRSHRLLSCLFVEHVPPKSTVPITFRA